MAICLCQVEDAAAFQKYLQRKQTGNLHKLDTDYTFIKGSLRGWHLKFIITFHIEIVFRQTLKELSKTLFDLKQSS